MKREIKFRAWCNLGKRMFSSLDIENVTLRELDGDNDQEYMQYTGLKDKNGKEIYEGDIVSTYSPDAGYEIGWYERANCWALYRHGETPASFPIYRGDIGVLLGNIYENPELINPI